jgi:hypothetical protein
VRARGSGGALFGAIVTSAALLGASASGRTPEGTATICVAGTGFDQEPLAATARLPSSTPPVALCEEAVRRTTLAAPIGSPRFRLSASGLAPDGSSSTSTTLIVWSGAENDAATRLGETSGEPSAVNAVGSGRSPASELVSRSAYHSGWARSVPRASAVGSGAHTGVYPVQLAGEPSRLIPAAPADIACVM